MRSIDGLNPSYLLAVGCFLEILRYYAELWLNQLIVTAFIAEKIWQKHRVRRYEVEEVLAHRQAIRLRHKRTLLELSSLDERRRADCSRSFYSSKAEEAIFWSPPWI